MYILILGMKLDVNLNGPLRQGPVAFNDIHMHIERHDHGLINPEVHSSEIPMHDLADL